MDIENVRGLKSILNTTNSTPSSTKIEAINQLLQTKGEEVQIKIEFETALALDNYQIALKKLRRSVFKECTDLKEKIKTSRKRTFKVCQDEIDTLRTKLEKEVGMKDVQFTINTSPDFPLRTRHYIPATTNVKVDTSSSYTIWNLCAFQQISKELDDNLKKMLTRPQVKVLAEKEIKELDQHRVNFVCQYLANKVSPHYLTMVLLARIINKPPTSLAKFWFRITKQPVPQSQRKIYAFKNAQYYCTVCNKYVCNLHYEEAAEDPSMPVPNDPDYEYSPYVTRYRVSYNKDYRDGEENLSVAKKKEDDVDLSDFYHSAYKCPQKSQIDCWRNRGRPIDVILTFNPNKFPQHEREYILNYCLKYGFLNPCVIRLLLGTEQKCWEIEAFINKNHSHPRNSMPSDLIKAAKRFDVKKLKKKTEPVAQIWKHYVPCYHPYEPCGDKCPCRELGNCEIFCGCPKDCVLRFPGCNCKPGKCGEGMSCNCFKNNRECDPELCKNCCCEIDYRLAKKRKSNVITCPNTKITYKYKPRLLLGKSSICDGMGIYAGQTFEKGDFIGEYVGEMIDYFEGDYRGVIYNDLGCSYMFDYEEDMTLDSFFYGNKLRFVNHGYGGMENSETKYKFVRGTVHIGLYAMRDIKIGDEVLFNYGENYQLDWLLEFNKKIRDKKKEEEKKRRINKKKAAERIDLFQEAKTLQEDVIFSDLEDNY